MPEKEKAELEGLVRRYQRDGFLFPLEILTAEEAVYYRQKYEEYVARYGGPG